MLLLFLIIWPTYQNCCDSYTCINSLYCLCDNNNNPVCATQLSASATSFTVNNSSPFYCYIAPTSSSYAAIQIILCGSDGNGQNSLQYGISSNNQFSNSSTPYNFSMTSQCQTFLMTDVNLQTNSNGSLQIIVFAISQNSNSTESMVAAVMYQPNVNSIIIPILIGIVGLMGLILLIVIALCIRRLYFRKQIPAGKVNQLDHFQKYMPIRKMSTQLGLSAVNCSVCICDIAPQEDIRRAPCCHIFHSKCIDDWCAKSMSCPMCRISFEENALAQKFRQNTLRKEPEYQMSNLDRNLLEDSELEQPPITNAS